MSASRTTLLIGLGSAVVSGGVHRSEGRGFGAGLGYTGGAKGGRCWGMDAVVWWLVKMRGNNFCFFFREDIFGDKWTNLEDKFLSIFVQNFKFPPSFVD